MEKTCIKCSHIHTIEKNDSQAECPKCGIIYAKAEATKDTVKDTIEQEVSDVDEQNDIQDITHLFNRRSSILNFLVLGCVACLFLYFYFGDERIRENEPKTSPQAAEQIGNPKSINTARNETLPEDNDDAFVESKEIIYPSNIEKKNDISDFEVAGPEREVQVSDIQVNNSTLPLENQSTTIPRREPADYYLAESTISRGNEVSLDDHMSDRRFTVFYFYADW